MRLKGGLKAARFSIDHKTDLIIVDSAFSAQKARMAAPGILIYDWLERIGLNHAVPKFKERGIDTPAALMNLTFQGPSSLS